jgi:hypothetical protein
MWDPSFDLKTKSLCKVGVLISRQKAYARLELWSQEHKALVVSKVLQEWNSIPLSHTNLCAPWEMQNLKKLYLQNYEYETSYIYIYIYMNSI